MRIDSFLKQSKSGSRSKRHSKKKSKKENQNTNVCIIDCSTLAYAAFYSYGHLSYNDDPTGVIFGFFSKLLLIAQTFKTNKFLFCWDSITRLHRENDYEGYKEKRRTKQKESSPEDIDALKSVVDQREELRVDSLPLFGFRNSFICDGFEADDLLAIFARKVCKTSPIVMVTTDADMYQCLDCCSIYNPQKKKIMTRESFEGKFKIRPDQWAKAKAIGGCDGDGVSGIFGAADPKKPTSKVLKYLNGELVKGIIFDRIESKEGRAIIEKNLPIVTTPYKEEEMPRMILRRDKFSIDRIISTFEKYGFYSFLKSNKLDQWKEWFHEE